MPSARASSAPAVAAPAAPSGARGPGRLAVQLVVAVGVLTGFGYGLVKLLEFERRPMTIGEVELPADGDVEPFIRELARQWHETEVSVDAGSRVVRATRRDLGASLDVDATLTEVRRARGSAPIWSRAWAFATAEGSTFDWHRGVREERTRRFVSELSRRATVDPQRVRFDGSGGRPGVTLASMEATAALVEALRTDAVYVRLPVRRLAPPQRPMRDERSAQFHEVVAAHQTLYAAAADTGRTRNIELAASFLDGALIQPRGQLSFNYVVGERTFERGFAPATELGRGGRRVEGIGGGVCQVAATLHAAAFFAGFDIVEHHPHTRNSSYIPAGLDAAVSWPNKDVRIRNPYPFHVRVSAEARNGTLRIELMGERRAPRVEWNTRVVTRVRRETEREVDPTLAGGTEEVVDEGEDGMLMERTRTVFWPDGAVSDTARLRYPVVHRLVRVGPGGAAPSAGGAAAGGATGEGPTEGTGAGGASRGADREAP